MLSDSHPQLYMAERKAFVDCVEEHHLDHIFRQNQTVKVNVAWDENDYQIDVGTEAGQTEFVCCFTVPSRG